MMVAFKPYKCHGYSLLQFFVLSVKFLTFWHVNTLRFFIVPEVVIRLVTLQQQKREWIFIIYL